MNIKINKHKTNFILNGFITFILIIILLILTKLSFFSKSKFISQRKLQSNELAQGNSTSDDIIIADEAKEIPYFEVAILVGFIFFCFMAIYILARLSKFPDYIKDRRYDLYTFIYFANNGNIIVIFFYILFPFNLHDNRLNIVIISLTFYSCSLVLIIGGICFIVNFVKSKCISKQFFIWGHLFSIAKLPCFVWNVIPLNSYCCICMKRIKRIKRTIHYYGDSDSRCCCCTFIWNLFIKLLKFISYIYCIIPFYLFYIVFIIGWLIAKLIYLIVLIFIKFLCCRKKENNISQNDTNQAEVQNDTNQNEGQNVTNRAEVRNDTNKAEGQNVTNKDEGQNDTHQVEGQNYTHQDEDIIVNINNNIIINQDSPHEKINKPDKKQMKNIDYLNDEDIHQKLNLSTNRNLNECKKSQGNPTPNKVNLYNMNQNPINESLSNSEKRTDKDDDVAF